MPPGKMKTYPTFAAWYQARSTGHKKIVSKLRKLVSEVAPKLVESSKLDKWCMAQRRTSYHLHTY